MPEYTVNYREIQKYQFSFTAKDEAEAKLIVEMAQMGEIDPMCYEDSSCCDVSYELIVDKDSLYKETEKENA